jgi:hypothetical protein
MMFILNRITPKIGRLPRLTFQCVRSPSATYGHPHTIGRLTGAGASLQLRSSGNNRKLMRTPLEILNPKMC